MPIRREDKEFIQALSLLGALCGAFIGFFSVIHLSDRARETHTEQTEYTQTQAALLKLKTTIVNPSNPISNENVLSQVQQHIPPGPAPEVAPRKSFWLRLPRWGYIGLCGGGGIAGAIGGYCSIWLVGWVGTIFVLYLIRGMYKAIGKVAPNATAVKNSPAGSTQSYTGQYQRNEERILPTLVKLFFLIAFILSILAAVVWHLTAI
ncbi:MAG: hypothetical protein ACYTCV_12385 [Planctomycetota bacterium]|jgi:hypothetical protein